MVEYFPSKNEARITIRVNGLKDLHRYRESLLRILDRIEIGNCTNELRNDLASIYELLTELSPEKLLIRDQS